MKCGGRGGAVVRSSPAASVWMVPSHLLVNRVLSDCHARRERPAGARILYARPVSKEEGEILRRSAS